VTKKLRITVNRLQVGMSVIELDRPWIETPFLLQGFTIGNRSDIKAIEEYCEYVYIDAESMPNKSRINKADVNTNKPGFIKNLYKKPVESSKTTVEKEISSARTIQSKTSKLVKNWIG